MHILVKQYSLLALALSLVAPQLVTRAPAAETPARPLVVTTSTTNSTPRYLTNVIEVTIPNNIFTDEYRTNWVRRDLTNVIDLFRTNLVTQFRTNLLTADKYQTNVIIAWRTNVKTLALTNWENVILIRTNWVNQPITNVVEFTNTLFAQDTRTNFVTEYHTNLVRAFSTNHQTVTVTNWETVVVATTNFVTRPVTNLVEIKLPPPPAPAITAAPAPKAEPVPTASARDLARALEFDLTHIGTPNRPGQFPIRLALLSDTGSALPVLEWRVEKTDGGALMVGSRAEFNAALPAGIYRVVARVRSDDGTTKNIRGNTEVKTDASAVRTPASAAASR
ncbi:MAG: hypothetical protein EXS35_13110 [Pedosphaera sp.]|nr:hypothetical protein [Pedosphaera sp.]